MIAVIFEVTPKEGRRQACLDIAAEMRSRLHDIDGFISVERFESLTAPGKLLFVSLRRDEAALENWRRLDRRRTAQSVGRRSMFADHRLRVAGVIPDYGMDDRAQAPPTAAKPTARRRAEGRDVQTQPLHIARRPRHLRSNVRAGPRVGRGVPCRPTGGLMPFRFARAAAAPAFALAALAATPALAQDQSSGDQSQAQDQAAQQDFSDDQLQAFAMAMLDVRDIVQAAEPKLAAAEGAEAKNEIRKSATEEMMQAVKESGLSVDAYNAIARTAGQNPDLAKKISGYVAEADGE